MDGNDDEPFFCENCQSNSVSINENSFSVANEYPCPVCTKGVEDEDSICCSICEKWVHLDCTNLTPSQFKFLNDNGDEAFYCPKCQFGPQIDENIISLVQNQTILSHFWCFE